MEEQLTGLGYRILALSADRPSKLAGTRGKHDLGYTLLSDSQMNASRAFGIAFAMDDAGVRRLKAFKIDLEEASGETHHMLPVPSVFIVDREGVVRFVYSNPDYRVRIDTDDLIEAARQAAGS